MLGLLKKDVCVHGEVLMIVPCKSIHSFGMREPIDVAFVDKGGCVLKVVTGLPPGRTSSCKHAACVLERRSPNRSAAEVAGIRSGRAEDRFGTRWFKPGETISFMSLKRGK
jgi:uncharacterized membrane protein (UPF0127 family)